MIVRNVGGVQTFELDEAELEAYVRAAVDKRLDAWFNTHTRPYLRSGFRGLLVDVGTQMVRDGRANDVLRTLVDGWLESRRGSLIQNLRKQLLAQVAAREDAVIQSALHKLRENQ